MKNVREKEYKYKAWLLLQNLICIHKNTELDSLKCYSSYFYLLVNAEAKESYISQLGSPCLYQGASAEAPQSLSGLLQLQSARGS